ncbi:hypothetical protein P5P86_01190 [Nocardioides sp. BP30]|uniref:hypothetical protein n=1 Tax=Nocardioides sp. BP30 TaxID=3036374 RepID=UPI002468CE5C|nr:hypothetical protein [Nocardioides sp. BP30]WGL52455.1 hypothetical protein P5P86_01190 [Nocardioides sp. BP30]
MATTQAEVPRVPVEHRWLGLDRRSIPYGLVALAVIALWAWVMPWVDDRVAWDDSTRAGEAIQVTDDITMSVAPGWGVIAGLRTSDETRSGAKAVKQDALVKDGVLFSIVQGPFDQSPSRLLDQTERITAASSSGFHVPGETRDVTTAAGLRGIGEDFTYLGGIGSIDAFVVDGTGIEIQVSGPQAQVTALQSETDAMIDSLAQDGGES